MDGMNQLIMLMANAMSMDGIVGQIESGIEHYRETGDHSKIQVPCTLLLSKEVVDNEEGGVMETINKLESFEKAHELVKKDPLKS